MTMRIPPVQETLKGDVNITNLASGGIFRGTAPKGTTRPYIVWSIISGVPGITLGCLPEEDDIRTRVDCYALDPVVCRRMMQAVVDAIELLTPVVLVQEFFEPDTELFRWMIDAEWINTR